MGASSKPIGRGAALQGHARWLEQRRRRRQRRRAVALAGLLGLGLALGTIWASGFAVTGGASSTVTANPVFASAPDQQDTSGLNGKITSGEDLVWSWQGQWGSIASNAMYEVDLIDTDPGFTDTDKFFVSVLLVTPPLGFADIQLELRIAEIDVGSGETCDATAIEDVANTADYRILTFETNDAQVTFSGMNGAPGGLSGDSTYCVGIADYEGSGQDPDGTFIRKSTKGAAFNGQLPTFVASLNRMD